MTPKEKAKQFLVKFEHEICFTDALQCSLIAVDEIVDLLYVDGSDENYGFWTDVKQELLNLKQKTNGKEFH